MESKSTKIVSKNTSLRSCNEIPKIEETKPVQTGSTPETLREPTTENSREATIAELRYQRLQERLRPNKGKNFANAKPAYCPLLRSAADTPTDEAVDRLAQDPTVREDIANYPELEEVWGLISRAPSTITCNSSQRSFIGLSKYARLNERKKAGRFSRMRKAIKKKLKVTREGKQAQAVEFIETNIISDNLPQSENVEIIEEIVKPFNTPPSYHQFTLADTRESPAYEHPAWALPSYLELEAEMIRFNRAFYE